MTEAASMARAIPKGPALTKKISPGMMKAPQPIMQPNANAQTFNGDNCFFKPLSDKIKTSLANKAVKIYRQSGIIEHFDRLGKLKTKLKRLPSTNL